jgi:cephalosporin-C deacetylase-like acetyl esterase
MNIRIFFVWVFFFSILIPVQAQDDVTLFNYWQYYSDVENSLFKYFCSTGFQQLEERKAVINSLQSKEDWLRRQVDVREKLVKIIGPFPEKTPLNARVTGVIHKEGYRVEKLIYESQPGYYVTSALFIPENLDGETPAILNPIGHSTMSFRRDIYQHTIINLVKKGFIVLAYDPVGQGERLQYYDKDSGKSRFSSTHEHSYPGAQCFISGYSPANYFIWDGIRGIDVLLSRKEVDPDRIGITGLSGGGTSTAFIAAFDDRILAAAPECYIANYKYLFKSIGLGDAEQNPFQLLYNGLDHPDFIEVRAPKPTLIISTTRDFFSIQGARESFQEAGKAYAALGAKNNLQMTEDDNGHGFTRENREAMYAFFQKYLNNPGDATDQEVEVIPVKELWATETGQLATSLKGETIYSLNKKIVEKQVAKLESARMNIDEHLFKVPDAARRISGFNYPQKFGKAIFSGRYANEEYKLEKYLIQGSGEYMLPLALFVPRKNDKKEAILLLHEKGKNYAVNNDSLARQLVANGYTVLLGDLPGIGELGPGYLKGDAYIENVSYNVWFAGILTGKSIVGLRAEDIIRMIHFMNTNLSDYKSVSAVSVGVLGSELLHAAVFEKDIQKTGLIQPFLSFADIALAHEYKPSFIPSAVAGAIEEYDLADLMAVLCPRKMLIIDPLSADGSIADEAKAKNSILFPLSVYSQKGVPGNFELISRMDDQKVLGHLLSWLK